MCAHSIGIQYIIQSTENPQSSINNLQHIRELQIVKTLYTSQTRVLTASSLKKVNNSNLDLSHLPYFISLIMQDQKIVICVLLWLSMLPMASMGPHIRTT